MMVATLAQYAGSGLNPNPFLAPRLAYTNHSKLLAHASFTFEVWWNADRLKIEDVNGFG